ncbi:hypothetical protein PUN28_019293 [Cardiocondyla obscurior]|uniref:Uncharacterized protein n=1 Tax=Cardiocondyla obscurior TaxID=286306 RepID=A0AAW2ECW9_9HYME
MDINVEINVCYNADYVIYYNRTLTLKPVVVHATKPFRRQNYSLAICILCRERDSMAYNNPVHIFSKT